MKPPRKLKIGYRNWEVQLRPEAEMNELNLMGQCRKSEGVIWLNEAIEPQIMAETLIHEALHAIWYTMNLPGKAAEENAVTCLATGWAGLVRDNPDLVKYLAAGLGKR